MTNDALTRVKCQPILPKPLGQHADLLNELTRTIGKHDEIVGVSEISETHAVILRPALSIGKSESNLPLTTNAPERLVQH